MLPTRPLLWLLLSLASALTLGTLASCERVELDNTKPKPKNKSDKPEELPQTNAYSVAEAQLLLGQEVLVAGYIVGVVEGTSLSKATFAPPFTNASNLLLADEPSTTNPAQCLPIALPNSSNIRDELNLKTNPSLRGRRLLVLGTIVTYFQRPGIRQPLGYELVATDTAHTTPPTPPRDTARTITYPTPDSTHTDTLVSRSHMLKVVK